MLFFGLGLVSNLLKPKAIYDIFPIDFHGETSPIQVAVESERRTPRAKAAAAEQMAREMAHPRKGTLRLQTVSSIKLRKEKQGESIICGCMVGNANPE